MISNNQRAELTEAFTKKNLEAGILPAVKKFYSREGKGVYEQLYTKPAFKIAFDKAANKKVLNKAELALLCFAVFENPAVYNSFIKTLPSFIQKLFEILVWRKSISRKEAEEAAGTKLLEELKFNRTYSEYELKADFYIFGVTELTFWSDDLRRDYILYLPKPLKEILVEYYPKPPHYNFLPIVDTPDGQYFFNGEKQLFVEMPAVISYHLLGAIKYTNSGRPNDASVNKMQRTCHIAEFYYNDDFKTLRTQLLAGMLYGFKVKEINTDALKLLKDIFENHYKKIYTPQIILTHLKGWGYLNMHYMTDTSFELLLGVFKKLPVDKWISVENLHDYINIRAIEITGVENFATSSHIYFDEPSKFGSFNNKVYAAVNTEKLVRTPFINGSVFLLAAFGLFEINYGEINTKTLNETYFSGYDGLKYLKLTHLGAYVLGVRRNYEAEYASQKNKLHFGEDSLVILAEGDASVLDVMLANFAEKEGNGRYRLTSAVFLKDCKNISSIDAKIALFKKTISANLPRYWEVVFAEWKANAKKIKEDISTTVFKIPADAKELQSLLVKDVVLKTLIFKAEGFYILVAQDNETKFKQRMKEFGYFIE